MITRRHFLLAAPAGALAAAAQGRNPVGCQNNAWQTDPADFEAFLRVLETIHRLGYAAFEANARYVQGQSADPKTARARIRQTGVQFFGAHTGSAPKFETLASIIEISAATGAAHLVLSGSGLARDGKLDPGAVRAKAEYLNRAGAYCRKNKMGLAYHNHEGEFRGGSPEMEELLRLTDPAVVSLLLDTGHAFLAGADVPAFVTRHHPRIAGMHIRDLKAGKQVPLGQGDFDQKPLAAAIRQVKWPGWLIIEEELRTTDFTRADATVQSDRRFLREVFAS